MIHVPSIAAALPPVPSFAENLQYQITGLLVVLFTLGGMALVVWLAGKIFIVRDRRKLAAAETAAAEVSRIPGEIYAAIAAAVSTVLEDEHFVIHGVRTVDPRGSLAWGAEGRRSIYATRNVR